MNIVLRSEREIGQMRRAGLVVWRAHQQAARLVRPGATTGQLDAAVAESLARDGAESLFLGTPGRVPFPATACISVNEEIVHGVPGERVLSEGDIVSVDIGARLDGWCGDAAVTHPVGQVDPAVQMLLDVTRGALELAIELLPRKSRWSEVAAEMARHVRRHGLAVVEQFVGHGIGRQMHEEPQVPNFDSPAFRQRGDFDLRPGLVLAVEPMVNMGVKEARLLKDQWTQVTADGRPSAHFEHTLALTKDGVRILTGPPEAASPPP
jgi:methionyl aminopeptidase